MFKVNVSQIMVKNFNEINMIELFKEKCNSIFRDWFVLGQKYIVELKVLVYLYLYD